VLYNKIEDVLILIGKLLTLHLQKIYYKRESLIIF